jgi:hypothetical protein
VRLERIQNGSIKRLAKDLADPIAFAEKGNSKFRKPGLKVALTIGHG